MDAVAGAGFGGGFSGGEVEGGEVNFDGGV